MSKQIRKDMLGNTPQIGDLVTFNPPAYKGIIYGEVVDFTAVGLPVLGNLSDGTQRVNYYGRILEQYDEQYGRDKYAPKTGFAIIKKVS